jgi:transposase InsO family protein
MQSAVLLINQEDFHEASWFLFNAALASGGAALTFEGFVRRFEAFADAVFCKVVGWALERTIATRLPKAALEQAIAERQPPPGLVHHSDRGPSVSTWMRH